MKIEMEWAVSQLKQGYVPQAIAGSRLQVYLARTDADAPILIASLRRESGPELAERNAKERWSLSLRDYEWLEWDSTVVTDGDYPILLILTEWDGTPRFIVEYSQGAMTRMDKPEPFYLIEAGWMAQHQAEECVNVSEWV